MLTLTLSMYAARNSNQKSNYPEMLGQIGLAFGCVNYLSTPETSGAKSTSPVSRQKIHPEASEKLSVRKASPDKTPSPGETIVPKISSIPTRTVAPAESRAMTLYGYNAAARLPFAFSHARERRSLRAPPRPAPAGRMVRSVSSGAAPPSPRPATTRPHALVDTPDTGSDNSSRGVVSLPGSPRNSSSVPVVGSAESLVTRVLAEQGLGEYCDPEFVRNTSREMQEALDMTQEQMDRAAHQLMVQEKNLKQVQNQQSQVVGRDPSPTIPSPPPASRSPTRKAVIAPTQNGVQDGADKRHSHHRRKRKRKPVLV
ncbi:unnamed protein product [Danaus chrysippus]|uniref:(African queen) hypothetical protein n=1 Tax=Danaus chrysippus TaxID=151541 RepID=A0A8J2QUW8_9NEOP|nr:unnamed protein product [Danaus chrysippus]